MESKTDNTIQCLGFGCLVLATRYKCTSNQAIRPPSLVILFYLASKLQSYWGYNPRRPESSKWHFTSLHPKQDGTTSQLMTVSGLGAVAQESATTNTTDWWGQNMSQRNTYARVPLESNRGHTTKDLLQVGSASHGSLPTSARKRFTELRAIAWVTSKKLVFGSLQVLGQLRIQTA